MSETNIYIVPVDEPFPGKRDHEAQVLAFLEEKQIVDGFYDEPKKWFAQGDNAHAIYAEPDHGGFEYAVIYDSAFAKLVPEIGYGFQLCPSCDGHLVHAIDELSETHLDEDSYVNWDMSDEEVNCPHCQTRAPLVLLATQPDTMMARFWIEFDCADGVDMSPLFLNGLAEIIGSPLVVLYERM